MPLLTEQTAARVVRPANHSNDAQRELIRIDTELGSVLGAQLLNEDQQKDMTAQIIAAGVRMLVILRADAQAWDRFKQSDSSFERLRPCKGKDPDSREVASVIWRRYRSRQPPRERVSMYGKAIRIAHQAWGTLNQEQIRQKLANVGGLKGVVRMVPKGATQRRKPPFPPCEKPTLYLVNEQGEGRPLDPTKDRQMLIDMGFMR